MLTITVPAQEAFNEKTGEFVKINSCTLKLEHSLLSLYKWESKHRKYFLDNRDLTADEILDYIRCMTLNTVEEHIYEFLTPENIEEIKAYLKDPMTATWFNDDIRPKGPIKKEILTAEVIYSSMIMLNIPIDIFEKRHLNHLLTLIRVCSEKQDPNADKKKMSTNDIAKHYSELNKARKKKLGTKG